MGIDAISGINNVNNSQNTAETTEKNNVVKKVPVGQETNKTKLQKKIDAALKELEGYKKDLSAKEYDELEKTYLKDLPKKVREGVTQALIQKITMKKLAYLSAGPVRAGEAAYELKKSNHSNNIFKKIANLFKKHNQENVSGEIPWLISDGTEIYDYKEIHK